MCGIAGVLDPAGAADGELARLCRAMADRLHLRGPDDGGTWTDAGAGLGLGHRRLAIIDLTAEGRQPMRSASGRFVISYNGEIYNFLELRQALEQRGVRFRGQSDTEVLVEAIAAWGLAQTLQRANGMFALALWDRERRVLALARDRMGQKPLYYGWVGAQFAFASELKALDALADPPREIDREALALFLRHGYVPEPWSIRRGIRKLRPGTLLELTPADVAARRWPEPVAYWDLRDAVAASAADPLTDEREAEERLDALLRGAVRACMVSDVPLGAFLSGGVDSSSVVALMQAESSQPVRTFTIGFEDDQYDEAAYAKAVARSLGTAHTELYLTDADARQVIPSLPSIYDEPFADSSQIPTYLVSRLARQSVTVSLSGDGGDEVFGGYNRYVWGASSASGIHSLPFPLRKAAAAGMRTLSVGSWNALTALLPRKLRLPQAGEKVHKTAGILAASSREAAYWQLTSLWPDPNALLRDGREPSTVLGDPARWPRQGSFVEKMMLLDAETYLPGDILTKLDRASMAVSLESRVPLLDHRVIEFSWRLPLAMKLADGTGKRLLRRVLDRYVPRALIERPKMGFGVPIDSWLRGALRDWAEELLGEERLRREGYLEPGPIRETWREHQSGRRNWQYRLWTILMFQSWLAAQRATP